MSGVHVASPVAMEISLDLGTSSDLQSVEEGIVPESPKKKEIVQRMLVQVLTTSLSNQSCNEYYFCRTTKLSALSK